MSLAQATQVGAIFDNGVGARALAMGKAELTFSMEQVDLIKAFLEQLQQRPMTF